MAAGAGFCIARTVPGTSQCGSSARPSQTTGAALFRPLLKNCRDWCRETVAPTSDAFPRPVAKPRAQAHDRECQQDPVATARTCAVSRGTGRSPSDVSSEASPFAGMVNRIAPCVYLPDHVNKSGTQTCATRTMTFRQPAQPSGTPPCKRSAKAADMRPKST